MSLGRLKCKDNNAAYVKRIMPGVFCRRTHQQVFLIAYSPMNPSKSSQKELDIGLS